MSRPRRRKGKPYDPSTVHDRKSTDLLRNAMVTPVMVDDPYPGLDGSYSKIIVMRSTRNDPLAEMNARHQIDACDYVAGRHWQAAWENAEIGGVRAIDPSKEFVDGGRMPEVLSDRQRRAVVDLKNARAELGADGDKLIRDVLGAGMPIIQAAALRGLHSEPERKYVGRRFRECLSCLAVLYGYSSERLEKA